MVTIVDQGYKCIMRIPDICRERSGWCVMDQRLFVAELNVEHFRRRLDGPLDDAQRRLIGVLLAEEEAKLSSLRSAVAERMLSELLALLAVRAGDLLDEGEAHSLHGRWAELAVTSDQLPCAVALITGGGQPVLANNAMRMFAAEEMPSRDPGGAGEGTARRIAAMPVTAHDGSLRGAIETAYELSALDSREVLDSLESLLVDEHLRARRRAPEFANR